MISLLSGVTTAKNNWVDHSYHDMTFIFQSSYNNTITLTNLQPYTVYIIHGAVSNYYTEYLSEALSPPVMYKTLIGGIISSDNFNFLSSNSW